VGKEQDAHNYDVDISLPPEAKMDLMWWSEAVLQFRDAQVLRGIGSKVLRQHPDAPGDGLGCTYEEYGAGDVDYNCGLFTPELSVVAYTDNSVSAACANLGTSKSAELLPLVKEMGLHMVEHGITCKCVWIPGRQLIRQGADPLSRGAWLKSSGGKDTLLPRVRAVLLYLQHTGHPDLLLADVPRASRTTG
jgi:hypothetical protein